MSGGGVGEVHPAVLSRFRRLLTLHRSIMPPGEETARRQLAAIDPHGILSMAETLGAAEVARELRVRVEASR